MPKYTFKRKASYLSNSDSDDNPMSKITESLTENLFENLFQNKKKNKHDDEVYREYNHIYFRTEVTTESIDNLLRLVREFEEEVNEFKSDPYSKYMTQPELLIHISTYGGCLYSSLMCYDTLKSKTYNVITIAEGYVASGGTIMMLGGKTRKIQKSAVMLIHQLSTGMYGKFEELKEDMQNSEQDMKRLTKIYFSELKGKMTKKQIEDALKHDYWWDADTCIAKGLCDEISQL
jgi:ATP-dependent protease ClpP protease subunit